MGCGAASVTGKQQIEVIYNWDRSALASENRLRVKPGTGAINIQG